MTAENSKKHAATHRRAWLCYVTLFIAILFFKNASAAAAWVAEGLRTCAFRLIPSLFPFLVLSSAALELGASRIVPKGIKRMFGKLFGVSGDGTCAIILGWLCGFPIGAKCAGSLYASGKISANEYKKTVCTASTPSPAFLISAVGIGMLGSAARGVILYFISVLASVSVGILLGRVLPSEPCRGTGDAGNVRRSFSGALTRAVTESASGMLNICAFVIFFSAFLGVAEQLLSFAELSPAALSVIFGAFELTSGLTLICEHTGSLPLCALAVGWCGFSVHFQTLSICSEEPVGIPLYLSVHFWRALFCFVAALAAELLSGAAVI